MSLSSQEIVGANIIRISVSTNTPQGGDSEADTFIQGLLFAVSELVSQQRGFKL